MKLIFTVATLFRVFLAHDCKGYESDVWCFYTWAMDVVERGFEGYYDPKFFCDYPPGYLYVLYLLGLILPGYDRLAVLILKVPAILCDLLTAWLISTQIKDRKFAKVVAAVYLFHPTVWMDSVVWGQVDSVHTLFIVLTCILLTHRKHIPAYFAFAVGILIKPQTLIFTPLILCSLFIDKDGKRILRDLAGGLAAIGSMALICLPFGLKTVINVYLTTLASYPYASVNAYNFWALVGLNWDSQDTVFGLLTCAQIGTIAIVLITLCAFLIFYRTRDYYMTGAFLMVAVFTFAVRMHERYMFPAVALLLLTYTCSKEREQEYLFHFTTLSLIAFGNIACVLYQYGRDYVEGFAMHFLSITLVVCFFLFCVSIVRTMLHCTPIHIQLPEWSPEYVEVKGKCRLQVSRPRMPFTRVDTIVITCITGFYSLFAFSYLGLTTAPQTQCDFNFEESIEIHAEPGYYISRMYWYLMYDQDLTCDLEYKISDTVGWIPYGSITFSSAFSWDDCFLPQKAIAVRLTNSTRDGRLGELVFVDESNQIVPVLEPEGYPELVDETSTFPGKLSPLTGSYFDESYYTKTAYEFLNGLPTYETTHPPFGKVLIALSALLFGYTPFGFRFIGTLLGVLMVPFLYLLGRNITQSRFYGGFISFLFAFDFMHFTQTRITTIDVYVTFFVILMYYFMECYVSTSFYDTSLKETLIPLGACGIVFGFGIASKWTGAYAGAGLAVIFFWHLYRRYHEFVRLRKKDRVNYQFIRNSQQTIAFCLVFFIAIPFVIYTLSYIPFRDYSGKSVIGRMLSNQQLMFDYHVNLQGDHPYSARWYEWPIMASPAYYYARNTDEGLRMGISAFGNPLVWWVGILAFVFVLYLAIRKKDNSARFLCIGYLAQYLPWILVSRTTFTYHYFPAVPFVALMIGYCFQRFDRRGVRIACVLYAVAALLLFLLFYPVLAGVPVSGEYVASLRWMNRWVLAH